MYLYTVSLVYWQLLLYGVHVGHSFVNSIIFSAWLVYTYRQNILIINLFKTVLLFKNGYVGLNAACHFSGPIWFINLHRSVELFVNYSAKQCGEFCYTTYWVHGLISNWITLANTFRKLNRMVKNSNKGQFSKLELDSSPLVLGRFSWPRASFVSSVHTSPHPTKESLYLGIPCLGIVDTNVSGHIANIAIPGNDDSLDCIVFYNTHVSQYILEKKYANVSGWFFNVRKKSRLIKFFDWVFGRYINAKGELNEEEVYAEEKRKKESEDQLKYDLRYKVSYNNIWTYGMDLFFSRNYGLDNFKEQVDLYEPEGGIGFKDEMEWFLSEQIYSSLYVTKIVNYYILKSSWRFNRFVKRNTLKNKLFKRRFLVGVYEKVRLWKVTDSKNYMKARFFVNRIFKTHLRRNKYRANKFILKFLKFYFIKKYMNVRGFVSLYTSNLLKNSSLAYVSLSFGSRLFKKDIFSPLLNLNNKFNYKYSISKKNLLYKWSFFKKGLKECLISIVNNKFINKYYKIAMKWKLYKLLKKFFIRKLFSFNISYRSFFNFFIWNRIVFLKRKFESYKHSLKIWQIMKGMQKNYDYLYFLNKANLNLNSFLFLFYKNKFFLNYFDKNFKRPYINYFFKSVINNYTKRFFLNANAYIYNKFLRIIRRSRAVLKKNKKWRERIKKIIKKYSKPRYKYIKHSKNYKGKKKLRKIKIPGRKFNFRTKFFKRLRYRKNKIVNALAKRGAIFNKNLKFLRLFNIIKKPAVPTRIFQKLNYLLKCSKYSLLFKFSHNIKKYNNIFSRNVKKLRLIDAIKGKHILSLKFYDKFFNKYSKSAYKFNSLTSRYCSTYYLQWEKQAVEDAARIKVLRRSHDLLSKIYITQDIDCFKLKNLINTELGHIYLRRRAYRVYKKALRTSFGISHSFLLGNNILTFNFFDKYWLYYKKSFYFPEFFYLDFKLQKFKIFKKLSKKYLFKSRILNKNNRYFRFHYFLPFFRIFSLYNKYFYSYYTSNFPFHQKLLSRINKTSKKIFWN